jgi:chemotaxis methyl-accepting protein methylase
MRNVLIYFGRGHRDKVLEKIRSQLKDEHSYLMLGASESIWSDPAFTVLRTESGSIYQKSQQSRDRV